MKKPAILFTSPVIHYPAIGGPYLRIETSIKALSTVSDLQIYAQGSLESIGGDSAESFYENYCTKFMHTSPPKKTLNYYFRIIANITAMPIIRRHLFDSVIDPKIDFDNILRAADAMNADLIWLGYGNISYPLLKHIKEKSRYKVVLDTDSVWSQFVLRGLPYAADENERLHILDTGKAKEKEEQWGTRLADVTTAVSDVDKEYYMGLADDKSKVFRFSNVIDMESYKTAPPPPPGFNKPCMYLAGSFWPKSPMDKAARWVLDNVFPAIKKRIPDIHFYIIGTASRETLSDVNDPNITITGRLESVLPYLCHADVALVPLHFESGTRFKILEAGACGIPIVSTTLGAEGLDVTHGKDILIADDPEDFAGAVVRLIQDKEFARTLALNCHKLVEQSYSIDSLSREAEIIIDHLNRVKGR